MKGRKRGKKRPASSAVNSPTARLTSSGDPARVIYVVAFVGWWRQCIFFVKATEDEAEVVSDILRRYEAASGQLVSLDKITVSFSGRVPRARRDGVICKLGVSEVEVQERYLGLPTVVGRSKKALTDIIRDKLSKRLQGWRGKTLSRDGREVLIKAIANSLPTYVMSVFKIPANFCNELRSMVSRF
ncbi:uncharacterized protein LOC141588439 [Silene latifolia]|uniref:uncharacterized protein LOC141588439 n=1 Tax=Silene latifolia TaxID=37657 RepID=UPI003D783473